MTTMDIVSKRLQLKRSLSPWRLATIGVVGLMVAISGCASPGVDDPTPAASQTLAPVGPSAQVGPSADEGDVRTTDDVRASDADGTPSGSNNSPATESEAFSDAEMAATPRPTPAVGPEPALSDEEIRETYGVDESEPADSVVGTLCNLSRPHFSELGDRIVVDGAIDDQMLRMAALSLSDDLGVWEGLAWQYPELSKDFDTARDIYAHWEYAVGLADAGDAAGALGQITAAAILIQDLPNGDVAEVGC